MAKEIILDPGHTFGEFSLLTGYTPADCTMHDVSLKTELGGLQLKLPVLSAAMTSVTGRHMALALGKDGGLGVLPVNLPLEEQLAIITQVKEYEMGFVENPVTLRDDDRIEKALGKIEKHGHSKIPIVNRDNVFRGMFTLRHYLRTDVSPERKVVHAMELASQDFTKVQNPNLSIDQALEQMGEHNYLVVVDEQDRLRKLAFRRDVERIPIGASIKTSDGWEERVEKMIEAGVDLISIDTSDGLNEFTQGVIEGYTKINSGNVPPISAGNVITYEGAKSLMYWGANIIKVGMASGSICTTKREKAVGRSPMTALVEADRARKDYLEETGIYKQIIMDGGVSSAADIVIALSIADATMMGGYFNHFYEAAAEKFDERGKETRNEDEMAFVATWGEGSARAKNIARYGHNSQKSFFTEGEEGRVPFWGRLKPRLKEDMMKVRSALSNAGCKTLKAYRENAILELMSPYSQLIVGDTHNMDVKK